jgi:hypothetical protein
LPVNSFAGMYVSFANLQKIGSINAMRNHGSRLRQDTHIKSGS